MTVVTIVMMTVMMTVVTVTVLWSRRLDFIMVSTMRMPPSKLVNTIVEARNIPLLSHRLCFF